MVAFCRTTSFPLPQVIRDIVFLGILPENFPGLAKADFA
jgi:hypothetical protein